ncbi:MAG: hypothetical protein LC744_05905 [Chloroflexi bacterium]|nr:hypothetical protein [Chloroflexota bacterium]
MTAEAGVVLRLRATFAKGEVTPGELLERMAGGGLEQLRHELEETTVRPTEPPHPPSGYVAPHT